MKQSPIYQYLPVTIIALGAVAVLFGTAMVALREQQRLRRMNSDDLLADTAEVDTSSADITAANEDCVAQDQQSEVDAIRSDDFLPDPIIEAPDAYVESQLNVRNSPAEKASQERFMPDDMLTDGTPLQISRV